MGDKLVLEGFLFTCDECYRPGMVVISESENIGDDENDVRDVSREVDSVFQRRGTHGFDSHAYGKVRITVERIE